MIKMNGEDCEKLYRELLFALDKPVSDDFIQKINQTKYCDHVNDFSKVREHFQKNMYMPKWIPWCSAENICTGIPPIIINPEIYKQTAVDRCPLLKNKFINNDLKVIFQT